MEKGGVSEREGDPPLRFVGMDGRVRKKQVKVKGWNLGVSLICVCCDEPAARAFSVAMLEMYILLVTPLQAHVVDGVWQPDHPLIRSAKACEG